MKSNLRAHQCASFLGRDCTFPALSKKKWCWLFFLSIVMLLCFMKAVCYAEILKEQLFELKFVASGQQERMDYIGARKAQEENLNQENPLEFVNWTQTEGMQISFPELGTGEVCAALLLCGRSDLLFPGYAVLDLEMQEYCLISSTLSEKLFGGDDTVGLMVEIQGRQLEVLDIVDSEETFLVYEAGGKDTFLFDRASVRCVSGKISKAAEGYQQLCGGGWEQMESRILVWGAQAVCFLVPFILWIFLICNMSANAGKDARAERMVWKVLSYVLIVGGIILLISKIQIPDDMIPAKWSDFSFWAEYGKKLGASCEILVRSEKKIPDMQMLKEFGRTLQWGGAAVVGEGVLLCGVWKMK